MKKLLIFAIVLSISTPLFAVDKDPLWEKYIKAKITFQNELADLFIAEHPNFKKLILASRDLQIMMEKMRQQKYYYLLNNNPGRIKRDQGSIQWSNFEWTEEDNKKLLVNI